MRRLAHPKSFLQAKNLIERHSTGYAGGMNVDDPASELSDNELAMLENVIGDDKYMEGRKGCRRLSELALPTLVYGDAIKADTYLCYKVGNKVYIKTSLTNQVASNLNEGDYIVWPKVGNVPAYNDQVTAKYPAGSGDPYPYFISRESATRGSIDSPIECSAHAKVYGGSWNQKLKKLIIHVGNKLYYTDMTFAAYTEITNVSSSSRAIAASPSKISHDDDISIVFNANGIYRIMWDSVGALYYPFNAAQPTVKINDVAVSASRKYGRRVIYTASRITGDHRGNRITTGNILEHETAPVIKYAGEQADAADVFTENIIGYGNETYGYLATTLLPGGVSNVLADWDHADAAFQIGINGEGTMTIAVDLSNPTSKADIKSRIDTALKGQFKGATFDFKYISGIERAVITSGLVDGGTIDAFLAPDVSFFDLTALLGMTSTAINNNMRWSAPVKYTGAVVPDECEQHTHISFYGSPNIGEDGILAGNNPDYLVWLMDIPRVRVWQTDTNFMTSVLTSKTSSPFKKYDEGATLLFDDGETMDLRYLSDDGASPIYSETSLYAFCDATTATNRATCIGANKCSMATQTGNTITLDGNAMFVFETDDIGKQFFWEDGTSNFIVSVVDGGLEATVRRSETRATATAGAWNMTSADLPTRIVSDYISDRTWNNRKGVLFYVLQTRYFLPLPSSLIGEVMPGFLCVAEANSNKHKYSEVPTSRKHQVGYYYAGFQEDDSIDDVITLLKRYPDRLIAFGKRSTWAVMASAVVTEQEPRIGFSASILQRFQIVDNRGLVHTGSLKDIDIGLSILVTHDRSVCIFNGSGFENTNVAEGKVMQYIETFDNDVISSYDNYGGYLLYGSNKIQTLVHNKLNAIDGTCLRLAVKPSQGSFWSLYTGLNMVWPEQFIGGLPVEDANDYSRQITIDETTGHWYEISTYQGADESGLTDSWLDKPTADEPDGSEIPCSFTLPERTGSKESMLLHFFEAHAYFRPMVGYTDYKTGFQIDAWIYKNGEATHIAKVLGVNVQGDIVFDRPAKAKRLQLKFNISTSRWRVLNTDEYYDAIDQANATLPANKKTTFQTYQEDYLNSLFWWTRGNELLNRATGNKVVRVGDAPELITGADGVEDSAYLFDMTKHIEITPRAVADGDFTIQFGLKFTSTETIPVVNTDEIPSGAFWDSLEKIGGATTFIARNLTSGRFEFVVENVTRAWLTAAGWSNTEISGSAATSMEIGFDQDRSCWLFFIDGALIGVIDGNTLVSNFVTAIPGTKYLSISANIHFDSENEQIKFYSRTTNDTEIRITGYIDTTGYHSGAPA